MAEHVISYPGSKWRFYKYMVDYFPLDMETFIEPFLGGGSVSLSVADDPRFTKLKRMIAGDLASEMWAFWVGVQQSPEDVIATATEWFMKACPHQNEIHKTRLSASDVKAYWDSEKNCIKENVDVDENTRYNLVSNIDLYNLAIDEAAKFWEWSQKVDTSTMSLVERAARILLVNKISFSGMGDSGSLSKDRFCGFYLDKLDAVRDASKLLQKIEIFNVSFEETMKYGNENPDKSFIFLDPPYYAQENSGLYGRNGDTHRGFPHEHFAEFTKNMKCKWFVTYDDSVAVRKLFKGKTALGTRCNIVPFTIPGGYVMSMRNSEDALAGEEVFIMNYKLDNQKNNINDII